MDTNNLVKIEQQKKNKILTMSPKNLTSFSSGNS